MGSWPKLTGVRRRGWKWSVLRVAGPILLAALVPPAAAQQVVKVGFISTYSGPMATLGDEMDKAVKLYVKLHADKLPNGVRVEVVTRDDGGPNPDKAKQIAQELIV